MESSWSILRRAARHPAGRWAVWGWVILLVGVAVRTAILPAGEHSVYLVFERAGEDWRHRADLYPQDQKPPGYPLFRYSPTVAVAFVPLTAVPSKAGDILLRLLNAAVLLAGLWWAARRLPARPLTAGGIATVFLLTLPGSPGGFSNGQCNALVIGLVLAGYAAALDRRFTLAAVALAAATLVKLYPVAPALLLVLLYPRQLGPRYVLAMLVGLGLPFLLADPGYVARQYTLWAHYFAHEDRTGWPVDASNIDFQFLVSQWPFPMSTAAYRVVEVGAGAAFAGLVAAAARRLGSADRAAWPALALGSVWMTTFGPATEAQTYVMLAPATALAVVLAWDRRPADRVGRALALAAWALPVSFQAAHVYWPFFKLYRQLGPQPLGGLVLTAAVLWEVWAAGRVNRVPAAAEPTLVGA